MAILPIIKPNFNCDGNCRAWAYEKHKTAAEFQDFITQVKNERIILPMNPLVITYGCVPAEATIRSMYYAGELQIKYDLTFDIAKVWKTPRQRWFLIFKMFKGIREEK
jgi:hypothetical protein